MENKKGMNFFFAVMLVVTGVNLYQDFDFQNLKFEKPLNDTIYLIAFVSIAIYLIVGYIKRPKK